MNRCIHSRRGAPAGAADNRPATRRLINVFALGCNSRWVIQMFDRCIAHPSRSGGTRLAAAYGHRPRLRPRPRREQLRAADARRAALTTAADNADAHPWLVAMPLQ
ncbi:hypothetical protein EVAR_6723_1 [Eumeta japonica]|uniref:Uncharacterized protein n=1 Tax=Eumeta variegata TaxID=151549 RepID=A0A4C1V566_EUMVA|nr:hypothetical protein EVAR_6723_1 [Eumeta japonica]